MLWMSGCLTHSHWHAAYTTNSTNMICDENGNTHNINNWNMPVCISSRMCSHLFIWINGNARCSAVNTEIVWIVFCVLHSWNALFFLSGLWFAWQNASYTAANKELFNWKKNPKHIHVILILVVISRLLSPGPIWHSNPKQNKCIFMGVKKTLKRNLMRKKHFFQSRAVCSYTFPRTEQFNNHLIFKYTWRTVQLSFSFLLWSCCFFPSSFSGLSFWKHSLIDASNNVPLL